MKVSTSAACKAPVRACQMIAGKKASTQHRKPALLMRWLVVLMIFVTAGANAQVSVLLNPTYGYSFANSAGTYTTLSGGTVFQSGVALNTDANSAAITLPSVFTFNGIKENTIFINNNGYITFALAQTTASNTVPLSTTTTSGFDGAIAGLANNLVAAATGTPEIRYGSSGGDFVIQFQDLAISTFTSTRITFQILLKADGKTVQIVYGPNNTGQTSATGSQVGLRGTSPVDWNNRALSSGGNWNTSGGAAGTSNTSTMTWTATSTLPTSGRTFTWSPTAYAPTYKTGAINSVEDFTTWVNGSGPVNVPGTNWATNGYGNASWQIDNTTASTTGSGWTGTSGAYSPVDYVNAVGGHSARFHAFNATAPQVGYLDYYVNLSGCGIANRRVSFSTILTGSAPTLQVYLSTDGGATFTLQTMSPAFGTNAAWVSRFVDLGAVTSATTIIRFKATSDFGSNDIGLDHVVISLTGVVPPTIGVTPTSANYCSPAGSPIALNASGGLTYSWSPATGLSASTGAAVTANPTSTTTYTVTGTDVNCASNTATTTITVASNPNVVASGTPLNVCFGANSQLLATANQSFTTATASLYTLNGSTTTYTAITGTTLGAAAIGDDVGIGNLPIGFTFNYNGSNHTIFGARSNGLIELDQATATLSGFSSNALASNANCIAPLWDDNNTTGGSIIYATTGAVGFRVLTVQWTGMHVGGTGSSSNPTIDMQLKLYEGTNKIEFIYGSTSAALLSTTASIGLSGASGNFLSVTPLSPANLSTTNNAVENTSISSEVNIPSGTKYTFTSAGAPSLSYLWSPTTFLPPGSELTANPLATTVTATTPYTVTVTGALSCSSQAFVTLTVSPLTAGSITTSGSFCVGSALTATANTTGGSPVYNYAWSDDVATVYPNAQTVNINLAAGAHTLNVTVTDACGGNVPMTLPVTINPLPAIAVVSGGGTFCTSTTITAANGNDGTMYFQGITLNGTSTATPSTSQLISASGTYYFRAQSAQGCWGPQGSTVVTIQTPASITTTPAAFCQGGSGTIAASSATGCVAFTNTGITFSNTFTAGDPTAKRPTTSIVQQASCSFDASILRGYQAQQFQVTVTGSYTLDMTSTDDGMAYVYTGAFTPGTCGTWIQGDDDSGPGNDPELIVTLTAGVTYTLISTTYATTNGNSTAAYTWTASTVPVGGQILLVSSTGNIEWYTTATGGTSIGTGSPFNPVGVAGSGLPDTNTPGTTVFYAACSNSSACRTPVNFVINANPTLSLTSAPGTNNQASCFNTPTPIIPITYAVAGAATGAGATGLPPGITGLYNAGVFTISGTATAAGTYPYTVTTTGGSCGTVSANGTIIVNAPSTATYVKTDVSICVANNGTITVTPVGTGPFTYSWTGLTGVGATVPFTAGNVSSLSGLNIGYYNVSFTDGNGCPGSITGIHIAYAYSVFITNNGSNTSSCGNTGTIILYGNAGVQPYTYQLDGGLYQLGNTFTGLAAGSHTANVKDAAGCISTKNITVLAAAPIVVSPFARAASSCNADGSIEIYRSGGIPPYQYSINGTNYFTSNIFNSLSAGPYTAYVKDAANCISSQAVTVTQGAALTVTATKTNTSTCVFDGTIQVYVSGGVSPYTYSKDGGSTFQSLNSFNGLSAGNYPIVVKDFKNCLGNLNVNIALNPIVVTYYNTNAPSCAGNGSIQLFRTGGVGPYTYSIDGNTYQASNTFPTVPPGTYDGYVKDSKTCIGFVSGIVVGPACPRPLATKNTNAAANKVVGNELFKVQAYPNPSASDFTLVISGNNPDKVSITVTDIMGRKVYQTEGSGKQQYRFGNNLKTGIYNVQVMQGTNNQSIKLVKE